MTSVTSSAAVTVMRVGPAPVSPAFTIGTLVNDRGQHTQMRASLIAGGFDPQSCEYLVIDNTPKTGVAAAHPQVDAFRGLNAILNIARAPIVILCHQDIRLLSDGRKALERRLQDIDALDPDWAVAGNAGGIAPGRLAVRISDPHGKDQAVGPFPARVQSLDENLLIVKRDARIGFSNDLTGFHLYGADLCLQAALRGHTAYVIDFHLEHLSGGRKDESFIAMEHRFRAKWCRALSPRWLQTTCTLLHLNGLPGGSTFAGFFERPFSRISKRLPQAKGWKPRRGRQRDVAIR